MKVSEILQIKNSKGTSNAEKAKLIVSMLKASARKNNPKDGDEPIGWAAGVTSNSVGVSSGGINL